MMRRHMALCRHEAQPAENGEHALHVVLHHKMRDAICVHDINATKLRKERKRNSTKRQKNLVMGMGRKRQCSDQQIRIDTDSPQDERRVSKHLSADTAGKGEGRAKGGTTGRCFMSIYQR